MYNTCMDQRNGESKVSYQILAKHPTEDREVVITFLESGYSDINPMDALPYRVDSDVEDSFIGASMFGWDAPVADKAKEWVAGMATSRTRLYTG